MIIIVISVTPDILLLITRLPAMPPRCYAMPPSLRFASAFRCFQLLSPRRRLCRFIFSPDTPDYAAAAARLIR
jgi:hypothetical protein